MAITDADANRITVLYRNAANNGFDSTNFGAGTGPTGIASGDFNNDGKQDLAVTNFYNNNAYVYLRNAGNTGFDSPISFATDLDSISVAVGDFNGDNRQDLVVANPPANNVSLLMRDCSAAGWISFAGAPYTTSETNADHDVMITVRRMFGSNGAVDINYSITDGTATTGDNDYSVSSASGTLHWGDGDAADKTLIISVKGDTKRETDETVNLQLSGVTGGATLISPNHQ